MPVITQVKVITKHALQRKQLRIHPEKLKLSLYSSKYHRIAFSMASLHGHKFFYCYTGSLINCSWNNHINKQNHVKVQNNSVGNFGQCLLSCPGLMLVPQTPRQGEADVVGSWGACCSERRMLLL